VGAQARRAPREEKRGVAPLVGQQHRRHGGRPALARRDVLAREGGQPGRRLRPKGSVVRPATPVEGHGRQARWPAEGG
jgi:hypothetical protein